MKFTSALSASLLAVAIPASQAIASPRPSSLVRRQDTIAGNLVLDPSVICTNCANDGQDPPVAGQVASLTSVNNFVNFCLGKTLTNGEQKVDGSCNAVPMGQVIPQANMPASKITFPVNGGTFAANTAFTFTMNVKNMILGNFVNAQKNYFGAPQQLQNGIVLAHSHVTVQLIPSIDSTAIPDPKVFAFFKGLNDPDVNGVLSTEVTAGLPAGVYRFCSMNTSANHAPVNVAVAQHGSLDDCIYATAVEGGDNGGNEGQNGNEGEQGNEGDNGNNGENNNGNNGENNGNNGENNGDNGNNGNNNNGNNNNGNNGNNNNGNNGDNGNNGNNNNGNNGNNNNGNNGNNDNGNNNNGNNNNGNNNNGNNNNGNNNNGNNNNGNNNNGNNGNNNGGDGAVIQTNTAAPPPEATGTCPGPVTVTVTAGAEPTPVDNGGVVIQTNTQVAPSSTVTPAPASSTVAPTPVATAPTKNPWKFYKNRKNFNRVFSRPRGRGRQ